MDGMDIDEIAILKKKIIAGDPQPSSFFVSTLPLPLHASTTLPLFSPLLSAPSAGSLLTSFLLASAGFN